MYNIRKITKRSFLEQYPNITDPNLMEETKVLKDESKQIFKVGRKIYTESVRKLHGEYNESYKLVFLTVFFKTKSFYCHSPRERERKREREREKKRERKKERDRERGREKQSCLSITCLHSHLML